MGLGLVAAEDHLNGIGLREQFPGQPGLARWHVGQEEQAALHQEMIAAEEGPHFRPPVGPLAGQQEQYGLPGRQYAPVLLPLRAAEAREVAGFGELFAQEPVQQVGRGVGQEGQQPGHAGLVGPGGIRLGAEFLQLGTAAQEAAALASVFRGGELEGQQVAEQGVGGLGLGGGHT